MPPTTTDPPGPAEILTWEREHLRTARDALGQMRGRTERLDPQSTGNWVSAQYLETLLEVRAEQLVDVPGTPPFFGRLDYAGAGSQGVATAHDVAGEVFHIGRRHVADEQGRPLVIDWRAPVSVPFYRASPRVPMGVDLRRRFAFTGGELSGFEDEPLTGPGAGEPGQASHILTEEIERPRVGPMRDIVATIQPEQDEIVRADLSISVCVQGAPGTGKTAVGLHRAAFLLYAHRDQLRRQRLLVIGPNDAFLRYIADVLPALGEVDASQTTIDELLTTVRGGGSAAAPRGRASAVAAEPVEVATLKGDARMAEVLRRALWSRLREPDRALEVPRGSRRFRVPGYEVAHTVAALRDRGSRYATGREMLPQRLAHAVLLRMEAEGDSPDDRVQGAVARSREVKAYTEQIWPAVKPQQVLFELFTDAGARDLAAEGVLTQEEQAVLGWPKPPRSAATAKWSAADAALVDELADLLERTPSLGHVVVDEAQDLSPDAVAGDRPPLHHRLGHRARRPRTGNDPLGGGLVGTRADPPRQARRGGRGTHAGLPRSRRGDRLRRKAAAPHRTRPGTAPLGPQQPRRARPSRCAPGRPAAHPGRAGPHPVRGATRIDRTGGAGKPRRPGGEGAD